MRVRPLLRANCDVNGRPPPRIWTARCPFRSIHASNHRGMLGASEIVEHCYFANAMPHLRTVCPMRGELAVEDTVEFRHVSVSLNRSWNDVYDFVSNGDNFGQWAS